MARDYADDPIKEKSREEIYKFANSILPKNRSQATAIYLASTNNRETLLLDRLDIPRANRLILEGNKSKIKDVEEANPGIKVIPMTTNEFFREGYKNFNSSPWWYCGLDYECMLGDRVLQDLRYIADNEHLYEKGFIYTNLVGMREHETKRDYMEYFMRWLSDDSLLKELFGYDFEFEEAVSKLGEELYQKGIVEKQEWYGKREKLGHFEAEKFASLIEREMFRLLPRDKLDKLRSYAITGTVHKNLHYESKVFPVEDFPAEVILRALNGEANPAEKEEISYFLSEPPEILFNDEACPSYLEIVTKSMSQFGREHIFDKTELEIEDYYRQNIVFGRRISTILDRILYTADKNRGKFRGLGRDLEKNALEYYRRGGLEIIPMLLTNFFNKGYVVEDSKSFFYTSQKNTRMMLDLMKVQRITPYLKDTLEHLIKNDFMIYYSRKKPYLGKTMNPDLLTQKQMLTILQEESPRYISWLNKKIGFAKPLNEMFTSSKLHMRRNLGSSSLPALTASTSRKLVLDGWTNEQIEAHYQVKNWGRIAALRANLTKGTIKIPKEKVKRIKKIKEVQKEIPLPGCKFLFPRKVYENFPEEYRLRVDYFRDEALNNLSKRKQISIRKAFSESHLEKNINSMSPIRFYAFFDDLTFAINKGGAIKSEKIKELWNNVRNSKNLYEVTSIYKPKKQEIASKKRRLPETDNQEIYEYIKSGISDKEIMEAFSLNPRQLGARKAWIKMRGKKNDGNSK